MTAAGALIVVVASLAFGFDVGDVAFFAISAVLSVVGAVLLRRPQTASKVVALVLALVAGFFASFTVFGLFLPDSVFDFVPGLLVVPGALLAIGAGIASIRAKGRPVGGGERRAVTAIVGAVGVLAVLSIALTLTGRETVDADLAADADLRVDLENFEFDRDSYDGAGGTTVLVKNSDPFAHTFTVDELDIDVDMGPLSEKLVTLPDDPGTYVLFCEPHTSDKEDPSEDDMAAVLTIG
jgi:plastocyanin